MFRGRTWVLFVALLAVPSFACRSRSQKIPVAADTTAGAEQVHPNHELVSEDLQIGSGETAIAGKIIAIHYTGWLNGARFDSSLDRTPLEFRLGNHEVLAGWDRGIPGMKVGGKRKLTIPPQLGYGTKGSLGGAIPPDSTLVFDIQLMNVKK